MTVSLTSFTIRALESPTLFKIIRYSINYEMNNIFCRCGFAFIDFFNHRGVPRDYLPQNQPRLIYLTGSTDFIT